MNLPTSIGELELQKFEDTLDAALNEHVQANLRDGMKQYIMDGIRPGDFLCACIRNNLLDATCRAYNNFTLLNLPSLMKFLYNDVPVAAWGSNAALEAWVAKGGERGRRVAA